MAGVDRDKLFDGYDAYYAPTLAEHGATPEGVNWGSAAAQEKRFVQFLKLLPEEGSFSLNDFGCGVGAFADYLASARREVDYCGFDVSEQMIELARANTQLENARFTTEVNEMQPADFTVACGVFNLRLDVPDDDWLEFVKSQIDVVAELSTRGFGFNLLTSYSDLDRRRPDLYYADPLVFFDYCKRTFSRDVALLHDYGEWEFTIWVRLES